MSALVALLLAQVAASSVPKENPAIQAFREACVAGSLKLSPARGRILGEKEITDLMKTWYWGRVTTQRTVVKLNDSRASFLVFVEYKNPRPGSIARSCTLVSKSVSQREATAAFLEEPVDRDVRPTWIPNMHLPVWVSDQPELGFRKTLEFGPYRTVLLEIGLYPKAAAQMNSGTTKQ